MPRSSRCRRRSTSPPARGRNSPACRLMITVHAPQSPTSQPFFVPVRPASVRERVEQAAERLRRELMHLSVDLTMIGYFIGSPPAASDCARGQYAGTFRADSRRLPRTLLIGRTSSIAALAAASIRSSFRACPSNMASALLARIGVGATAPRTMRIFRQVSPSSVKADGYANRRQFHRLAPAVLYIDAGGARQNRGNIDRHQDFVGLENRFSRPE